VLAPEPGGPLAEGDLVRIPPGAALAGAARALVLAHPGVAPEPPPASWERLPAPPFAPAGDPDAPEGGQLPLALGGLSFQAVDAETVQVASDGPAGRHAALVPRRWAARMLFRAALHGLRLGRIETYGGLYWDDRGGMRLGIRGGGEVALDPRDALATIERLYRAIAPDGYTERLPD
jgi:hypothetical protein